MISFPNSARARRRLRIVLPAILLLTVACASTPPIPSASLQAAQQSIASAERDEAGTHAAAELGEARDKLSAAQHAVDDEAMVVAGQLADEARVEADYAAAKTRLAKANAVNADIERGNATLIEEMQRKTGDSR